MENEIIKENKEKSFDIIIKTLSVEKLTRKELIEKSGLTKG